MSLVLPDARDWHDAHGFLEQDVIYSENLQLRFLKWQFFPVDGFKQFQPETDDMVFNYVLEDFGRVKPRAEMVANLKKLNLLGQHKYKLLICGRHGEGYHNVASAKYPGKLWAKKYRFLGTDGEITWGPDPDLTDLGKLQAQENHQFLVDQISKGMPIPSKFYVSPLSRSIETMMIEWDGIDISRPVVVEKLREIIGVNPCHKRLEKSVIQEKYPQLDFEPGFSEGDLLDEKHCQTREQFWQQFMRLNEFLQELFDTEDEVVSLTSHAGTIRALLTVIGHRKFTIPKGGMIPVIVRGQKRE